MQYDILWAGREYHSLENCLVLADDAGADIESTVIGSYQGIIYQVTYHIRTDKHWQVVSASIISQHSNRIDHYDLHADGAGNWTVNGKQEEDFNECTDVDIPLTPFTNTLPINRLSLAIGDTQEISVVYIDLLVHEIKPLKQRYTRLSHNEYLYENVPNDFEATITVDDNGLVVDYPTLFERTAILEAHYS